MGAIGAIAGIIDTGLKMIDKHIDDPVRRLKARQDYIDDLRKQVEEILDAKEIKELDEHLLAFISAVRKL